MPQRKQDRGPALEEYRRKRDFKRTGNRAGAAATGLRRDKDPASVTREVARS